MLNKMLGTAITLLTMTGSAFAVNFPGQALGDARSAMVPVQAPPDQSGPPSQGMTGPGTMDPHMSRDSGMMHWDQMDWDDMPMMRGQMPMMRGMGPDRMMGQHVEGRIAFLKAELGITSAQEPQWTAFADALRTNAHAMVGMHQQMMDGGRPTTLPQRLDWHEQMMASHLDALRRVKAAAGPLYAILSDQQKRVADSLIKGSTM